MFRYGPFVRQGRTSTRTYNARPVELVHAGPKSRSRTSCSSRVQCTSIRIGQDSRNQHCHALSETLRLTP
jgi:hypothetical protein